PILATDVSVRDVVMNQLEQLVRRRRFYRVELVQKLALCFEEPRLVVGWLGQCPADERPAHGDELRPGHRERPCSPLNVLPLSRERRVQLFAPNRTPGRRSSSAAAG